MDAWDEVMVFGSRADDCSYTIRPSAYALLIDDERRVAVVRTPEGTFLPGGGVENDETPEAAVAREALEECGFILQLGPWVVRAIQFVYSVKEATHFEKRSTFFEAEIDGNDLAHLEADHETLWLGFDTAKQLLSHDSHRWATEQWRLHTLTGDFQSRWK